MVSSGSKLNIGDYVMKTIGFGAGILKGIVIGIEKDKVIVFTENKVDKWITKFVEVMYEV